MISFNELNIILGLLVGLLITVGRILYWKKTGIAWDRSQLYKSMMGFAFAFFATFCFSTLFFASQYAKWQLHQQINRNVIMSSIQKYHPTEYRTLIDKVDARFENKEPSEESMLYVHIVASNIFLSDLQHASNEAIERYLNAIIVLYENLYTKDPSLIVKIENYGFSSILDFPTLLEDRTFRDYYVAAVDAKNYIIQSAVESHTLPSSAKVAEPLFQSIMAKLVAQYGQDAVNGTFHLSNVNVTPILQANVLLEFYRQINQLDPAEAGMLMRYFGWLASQKAGPY
jgi:hypothetical protein